MELQFQIFFFYYYVKNVGPVFMVWVKLETKYFTKNRNTKNAKSINQSINQVKH